LADNLDLMVVVLEGNELVIIVDFQTGDLDVEAEA
jgi:hypothetical protein